MRTLFAIAIAALMGCGTTPTDSGKHQSAVRAAGGQIPQADETFQILARSVWVYNPQTKVGTVTLTITDQWGDTMAWIQRGTLTNRHECTAGGFAQALSNTVLSTFENLEIPDTSSNCIESEW